MIYCKQGRCTTVLPMCVWFLPPLSISCPPLLPLSSLSNKQHEGGYNWEVQSSARWNHLYLNTGSLSLSLSRSLSYIVSLPLSLLLYPLFPSVTLSPVCLTYNLSLHLMAAAALLTWYEKTLSPYFVIYSSKVSRQCFSFSLTCVLSQSATVYSPQYNCSPPHPPLPEPPTLSSLRNLPSVAIKRRSPHLLSSSFLSSVSSSPIFSTFLWAKEDTTQLSSWLSQVRL